jgi:TolB-like protein/class 3 adenylate cyclase
MASNRRLTAILAADVAGYSRLMGSDEEGTHERLQAHLRELVDPKIEEHRGRVVKNTGDGFLAEFASVVDAVRYAVEVQRGMSEREPEVPEERRIRFRMGINLGDVIAEEHDIFGDGVNVAARLEALAEPGGICVSRTVKDQIQDRLLYPFEDMGEQSVKNIARPVRAYALRPEGITVLSRPGLRASKRRWPLIGAAAAVAFGVVCLAWWFWPAETFLFRAGKPADQTTVSATAAPSPPTTSTSQPFAAPRLSIVVLPFANLSNDPEQQYFVDGLTDDLTTDLSRIAHSFVISHNTAFTYRNRAADTKRIGRELGVRYVLEGSVRRSGNQLRVNTQLIDAESDTHLWAVRFDRDTSDLFALQKEITSKVATWLNLELVTTEAARPTENPDALEWLLRGRAAGLKPQSRDKHAEQIAMFERALALDPRSAEAQSLLATALINRLLNFPMDTTDGDIKRAEELAAKAVAASPHSALAHYAKGSVLRAQRRCREALPEYQTALALYRNYVEAIADIGRCKTFVGPIEEVIPAQEQAIRLSPRDPAIPLWYYRIGVAHLLQSRIEEAVLWLEKSRSANAELWFVHAYLASAYALDGEGERAATELTEARKLGGEGSWLSIARIRASARYETPAIRALAEATIYEGLRKAGLPEE